MPTISAGVPRIEKDPHGGDVVIVPVRPYAKDMDRCTRCGKHVRCVCSIEVRPMQRNYSVRKSGRN